MFKAIRFLISSMSTIVQALYQNIVEFACVSITSSKNLV